MGRRSLGFSLLILTLMAPTAGCWADERGEFSGVVVSVSDGDTLTVLRGSSPVKIRLYGIDCPEKGQDFASRARIRIAALSYRKSVVVQSYEKDRFGRIIGRIATDAHRDLGLTLVEEGLCWWYQRFAPRDVTLEGAQKVAKERKLGVWSRDDSVAPWAYRRAKVNFDHSGTSK